MASAQTTTSIPPELAEMLDKQAIREVLIRYCRGWDRLERDLVQSVYHPEATDDHGMYRGPGREFFDAWAASPEATNIHHHLGQSLIEVDGDTAVAETYCLATTVGPTDDGPQSRMIACRFLDRFEKRGREWRIADRQLAFDANVVVPGGLPEGFPERNRGTRDGTDPSHRLFTPAEQQ